EQLDGQVQIGLIAHRRTLTRHNHVRVECLQPSQARQPWRDGVRVRRPWWWPLTVGRADEDVAGHEDFLGGQIEHGGTGGVARHAEETKLPRAAPESELLVERDVR